MARGRRWTEAEDTAVERATLQNLELGILDVRLRGRVRVASDYVGRLERLAQDPGRSCAAVLKRARRLQAMSYRPRREGKGHEHR